MPKGPIALLLLTVKAVAIVVIAALGAAMPAYGAKKPAVTSCPLVQPLDPPAPAPEAGLEGKTVAVWGSHGWYYEPQLDRWEWQRCRLFGTVEDLLSQAFVLQMLTPMLQNAGASVLMPRERDTSSWEAVLDNDSPHPHAYAEHNGKRHWKDAPAPGFRMPAADSLGTAQNPFREGTARMVQTADRLGRSSNASWTATVPEAGTYAVYVSWQTVPGRSVTDAVYTVNSLWGPRRFQVDQTRGGGTWVHLGDFPLAAGNHDNLPIVTLSNVSADHGKKAVVTADAVRIGGGLGNVSRGGYGPSRHPRFTEGARYWLQWAGMPDSVYAPAGEDYKDDYQCRPLWLDYISGGSLSNPSRPGLGINVDAALAWHSDAGLTQAPDSTVGTLAIYSTAEGKLGDGSDCSRSGALARMVSESVVRDIRRTRYPRWNNRGLRDKPYYEARYSPVPTVLLELLSHQNPADVRQALDPQFRFIAARAVYKAILRFLAQRDGRQAVVQPLPPHMMALRNVPGRDGQYLLSWQAQVDSLEPSATPRYYMVERLDHTRGAYLPWRTVTEPRLLIDAEPNTLYALRVVAGNTGGVSFPSETLAMMHRPGKPEALIVNGFTRISGPPWWEDEALGGMAYERDMGVPYMSDISHTGPQVEWHRAAPWTDDDSPGFGASRGTLETTVIAGNTMDYPVIHGIALAKAGYGFTSLSAEAFANSVPAAGRSSALLDVILGKQDQVSDAFAGRLCDWHLDGVPLMVSGEHVGVALPTSTRRTLGFDLRATAATALGQTVGTGPLRGRDVSFNMTPGRAAYCIQTPDAIEPLSGTTVMRYTENSLSAAIVSNDGHAPVAAVAFPLEITDDPDGLMEALVKLFSLKPVP